MTSDLDRDMPRIAIEPGADTPFQSITIEPMARGSYRVTIVHHDRTMEHVGFSNGADLLHFTHGELQGPRAFRRPQSQPITQQQEQTRGWGKILRGVS